MTITHCTHHAPCSPALYCGMLKSIQQSVEAGKTETFADKHSLFMTESFQQLNELMVIFGRLVATLFITTTLQSNCIPAIYYHHQIFIPALCVHLAFPFTQAQGSARCWFVHSKHLDGRDPCGHLLPLNPVLMENISL